jgi:hypothetical protein
VSYRVFVFNDGKVVGATPLGVRGEGRDVGFITCARDFIKEWQFDKFADKGFTITEVAIHRGVDNTNK